jgi:hypothetical protein
MLADRQAQDDRIEDAMAAALLASEDRAAAQAQVEQEERVLAAALQRLSQESVAVRDIMTMTGLGEKYVTRLLRLQLVAATGSPSNPQPDQCNPRPRSDWSARASSPFIFGLETRGRAGVWPDSV